MQVQFYSVGFDSDNYNFSVVNDRTLIIVTSKGEMELEFDSNEDAEYAQRELNALLNAKARGSHKDTNSDSTFSFSATVNKLKKTVLSNPLVQGAVDKATQKVSTLAASIIQEHLMAKVKQNHAHADKKDVKDTASEVLNTVSTKAQDLVRRLQGVLDNPAEQAADEGKRPTAKELIQRLKGTEPPATQSTNQVQKNVPVSELTDEQLKKAIDEIVDKTIKENSSVKEFLDHVKEYNSPEDVEKFIQKHKETLFEVAREYDHLTLEQVVEMYLS